MNTIIEFYQDLKHYSDRNVRLMALHEGLPLASADDLRWMLAVKHSHQKGELPPKPLPTPPLEPESQPSQPLPLPVPPILLPLPALVALAEQGGIRVLRKYVVNKERLNQVLGALPLLMKTVGITKKQLREILLDDYKLFGELSTPESIRIVKDAIFERCNEVVEQGDRRVYRLCGITHRDDDLPAIVSDAEQHWFKAGKRHREGDRPAIVHTGGAQTWYKHGKRHRDGDKPADIYPNGSQIWYKNGKIHRDGDKPADIQPNGSQTWYKNGKIHRDNGPAHIYGSTGDWYTNGNYITSKAIA